MPVRLGARSADRWDDPGVRASNSARPPRTVRSHRCRGASASPTARFVDRVALLGVALLISSCAAREIPPDPGPAMQPRASWTIRAGKPSGRGRIVCRSDVATPCVIPLAATGDEAFAAVSVYLYAVGVRTTYQGIFFVSFIGDTGYESNVTYQIDPGAVPTSVSVVGKVVNAPGRYEFRLALGAEGPANAVLRQLEFEVPVDVVSAREAP